VFLFSFPRKAFSSSHLESPPRYPRYRLSTYRTDRPIAVTAPQCPPVVPVPQRNCLPACLPACLSLTPSPSLHHLGLVRFSLIQQPSQAPTVAYTRTHTYTHTHTHTHTQHLPHSVSSDQRPSCLSRTRPRSRLTGPLPTHDSSRSPSKTRLLIDDTRSTLRNNQNGPVCVALVTRWAHPSQEEKTMIKKRHPPWLTTRW
jgi:hypothetical protein